MKKNILLVVLVFDLLGIGVLRAGLFDDRFPSARATAMGGAGAALSAGVWSAYYNPAGLSTVENPGLGTSYLRLFNVTFFKNFFAAAALPLPGKLGTVSANFQYFGVDYKGNNLSGEYTFALSQGFYLIKDIHTSLSLGYSLKGYFWKLGSSLQFGDLGSAATVGLDLGLQASIYQRTFIGVYFLNINAPQLGEFTKHDLPQRIVVGVAYQPYDGVTTTLDLNRTIGVGEMQLWGGAEFNVFRNLFIRFGGTSNPNRFSAGLGIQVAQFRLNYALITHNELGETHQIGFLIEF